MSGHTCQECGTIGGHAYDCIAAFESEIATLHAQLAERETSLKAANLVKSALLAQITDCNSQLAERDAKIAKLERVVEAARGMAKLEGCDLRGPEFKDAWLAIYHALAALDDPKDPTP